MAPTEKQIDYIKRIITFLGRNAVSDYIKRFYPNSNIDCLTKCEAQKIITGLSFRLPGKPILRVCGRDIR